jgi:hypothetical protein
MLVGMAAPQEETPDLWGAFPRLSDAQIAALAAHGAPPPSGT